MVAKFCKLVAQYPCLYDPKNKHYQDSKARQKAWKEIAKETRQSVANCQKRWKNVRNPYMELNKINTLAHVNQLEREVSPASNVALDTGNLGAEQEASTCDIVDDNLVKSLKKTFPKEENRVNASTVNRIKAEYTQLERWREMKNRHVSNCPKFQKVAAMVVEVNKKDLEDGDNRGDGLPPQSTENKTEEDPIDVFFKNMAAAVKKLQSSKIRVKVEVMRIIGDLEA